MERPRRLRINGAMRQLVRETSLKPAQLIYPLFVVEGKGIKEEIAAMPGQYRYSIDRLPEEIEEMREAGVGHVLLFGVPYHKDAFGSSAYDRDGVVQRAVGVFKERSDIFVTTDICLCQYTDHGHCGLVDEGGYVQNDDTLEVLAKVALSHAEAGADMVAPSDMMDGRVAAIRRTLDRSGYETLPLMAYTAKYASAYYGPFRQAAQSQPGRGGRGQYQMDYHNGREAEVEAALDLAEGADIIMIKPALAYLDVIYRLRQMVKKPLAAYSVSGEYSMAQLAIERGILKPEIVYENHVAIKRAGADILITYHAKTLARYLKEGQDEK